MNGYASVCVRSVRVGWCCVRKSEGWIFGTDFLGIETVVILSFLCGHLSFFATEGNGLEQTYKIACKQIVVLLNRISFTTKQHCIILYLCGFGTFQVWLVCLVLR